MSMEEYERIWRETNAELAARKVKHEWNRYDIIWNQVFKEKLGKLKGGVK